MRELTTNPAIAIKLAAALQATFNIGDGMELVCILGNGSARDNREALAQWVSNTLRLPDHEVAATVLPLLVDRLEVLLRRRGLLPW